MLDRYKAYIDRVKPDGISFQTDVQGSSKRKAYEYIMGSPALSHVNEMELVKQSDNTFTVEPKKTHPALVSDKDSFYERIILYLPDTHVKLGTYIKEKDDLYIVTLEKRNPIYPETEIKYCNFDLPIEVEKTRVEIGRDEFGKPVYEYIGEDYTIPVATTSKMYSALGNSQVPLPVGAIYMYTPYHKDINIPTNYEFLMYGDTYQVTSSPKTTLLEDEDGVLYGYLEVRCQRKDDEK